MVGGWSAWQVIYTDPWSREFGAIVRKRIPYSTEVAEETMLEVRQELAIKLCKLEQAPTSVDAYLRTAFRNTLEDYLRKKEGYPRPPEWIKRLGAAYVRIYKMLCLENRSEHDIHAQMQSAYQYTRDFIRQIISEVRAGVINCGSWRESVPIDNALAEIDSQDTHRNTSPDAILQNMDSQGVIDTILGRRLKDRVHTQAFSAALDTLAQCELNDDERLLLRLVYTEGHSISKAAHMLSLADAQARKTLKQCLQRLKQALSDADLTLL